MYCCGECGAVQPLWKTTWQSLERVKHRGTTWPSNSTPPWELKTCVLTKTYTWTLKAALFIRAKTGNNPGVYPPNDRINKSGMSMPWNCIPPARGRRYRHLLRQGWTLQTCWVKEAGHKRTHILWFHLYKMSRTGKPMKTKSRLVASGWTGVGKRGAMGSGWWKVWGLGVERQKRPKSGCDGCTSLWLY